MLKKDAVILYVTMLVATLCTITLYAQDVANLTEGVTGEISPATEPIMPDLSTLMNSPQPTPTAMPQEPPVNAPQAPQISETDFQMLNRQKMPESLKRAFDAEIVRMRLMPNGGLMIIRRIRSDMILPSNPPQQAPDTVWREIYMPVEVQPGIFVIRLVAWQMGEHIPRRVHEEEIRFDTPINK